jgi:Tol biopolymer transport system component
MLGWSWNGKKASYVANTNGQSILYIRDFDGKTFGKDYKEFTISKSGRIRGWSWDGETASYVAVTNGQAVLYIQKFDGTTFVNTNKTFVSFQKRSYSRLELGMAKQPAMWRS